MRDQVLHRALGMAQQVGGELLDRKLSELDSDEDEGAGTLGFLGFVTGCETLRQLIAYEGLDEALRELSGRERHMAAVSLMRRLTARSWNGVSFHPVRPARHDRDATDEPPRDEAALSAWARKHCPDGVLERPALVALPFLRSSWLAPELSGILSDSVLGAWLTPSALSSARHLAIAFRGALRDYLAATAHATRRTEWRETAWARAPEEPALAALAELLRAEMDRVAEPPALVPPHAELSLSIDPPTLTLRPGRGAVVVSLASWEVGHVGYRASGLDDAGPWLRAALEALLDAVHDPADRLHAQVFEIVRTPVWSRLVRAIEASRPPPQPRASIGGRIVWRLHLGASGAPEPYHQKQRKNGGWTNGARQTVRWMIDAANGPNHPVATELDHHIAAELAIAERAERQQYAPNAERSRWTRIASLLARHPLVFVDDGETPVDVRLDPLSFVLEPAAGGLEVRVRVGHETLAPVDALERQLLPRTIAVLDPRTDALHLHVLHDAEDRLLRALAKYDATIPPDGVDRVLAEIVHVVPDALIELPPSLSGRTSAADGRIVLRIAPRPAGGARVVLAVRPTATGPLLPPGAGARNVLALESGERIGRVRDLDAERDRAATLCATLGLERRAMGPDAPYELRDDEALLELLDLLRDENDVVVEWPEGEVPRTVVGSVADVNVRVKRFEEWLGVEGEARVEAERVRLRDLLRVARAGGRFVALGRGRYARIADELRARLDGVVEVIFEHDRALGVGFASAAMIEDLVRDQAEIEGAKHIRDAVATMDASRELSPTVPAALAAELRPYQREGFEWLARLAAWGLGGCLADDMGLGKTLQALALLLHRAHEGPALVVAPTSVVDNWRSEAARFAPTLRTALYRGKARKACLDALGAGDVLVTSYDVLLRDQEALGAHRFATLVVDEAQAMKNAASKRARAVCSLSAAFRIALTGTPVENRLGDLWSIFHAVQPGLLGPAAHFRGVYAKPIERDGNPLVLERLKRRIAPFVLRRKKSEVATELPPRIEMVHPVALDRAEKAVYDAACRDAAEKLARVREGDPEARLTVLAELMRLRQLACHPRLVDPASTVRSSKLAVFEALATELVAAGHRALVFSQFTRHLALVRERLDARRIPYLYLDGATPAPARRAHIDAFSEGDAPFFLISLKAGGTGLNLTAADTVIHLDPWWNPATEDQASDRAHRIGQAKPVTIVRLVASGTIEETVYELHAKKRDLAEGLLADAGASASLSTKELIALVRAGAGAGAMR